MTSSSIFILHVPNVTEPVLLVAYKNQSVLGYASKILKKNHQKSKNMVPYIDIQYSAQCFYNYNVFVKKKLEAKQEGVLK